MKIYEKMYVETLKISSSFPLELSPWGSDHLNGWFLAEVLEVGAVRPDPDDEEDTYYPLKVEYLCDKAKHPGRSSETLRWPDAEIALARPGRGDISNGGWAGGPPSPSSPPAPGTVVLACSDPSAPSAPDPSTPTQTRLRWRSRKASMRSFSIRRMR